MDAFIGIAQMDPLTMKVQCITLNIISSVFQLNNHANWNHKEPISESKIQKGDATWATSKVILGCIGTMHKTIQLMAHRKQRLQCLLMETLAKKCISW